MLTPTTNGPKHVNSSKNSYLDNRDIEDSRPRSHTDQALNEDKRFLQDEGNFHRKFNENLKANPTEESQIKPKENTKKQVNVKDVPEVLNPNKENENIITKSSIGSQLTLGTSKQVMTLPISQKKLDIENISPQESKKNLNEEKQIQFPVKKIKSGTPNDGNHPGKAFHQNQGEIKDIIIMCPVDELAQAFFRRDPIVWYDPEIESEPRLSYLSKLMDFTTVQTFTDWRDALKYIQKCSVSCKVITSGQNGESLVKEINDNVNVLSIYLFCDDIKLHEEWTENYNKIIEATGEFSRLEKLVCKEAFRDDFPAFAPAFNDMDTSKMNDLHFYLKGLIHFSNRDQAKEDFLTLAHQVYRTEKAKQDILQFSREYQEYSMEKIFHWYTRHTFLFKLLNNSLRVATSDSILSSRLIITDIESAIKEYFQIKSKAFSGLLYRGCPLSDENWKQLKANVNKQIEMHGFLSTTKDKKIAKGFTKGDPKSVLITIIVLDALELETQGFAEIREFSKIEAEDEVLFNIMSRFTILGVKDKGLEGCRELVLLYGVQAIQKFISEENPKVKIHINKELDEIKCRACNSKIYASEEKDPFGLLNLSDQTEWKCINCSIKPSLGIFSPYLIVSKRVYEDYKKYDNRREIIGRILKPKKRFDTLIHRSHCSKCGKNGEFKFPQFSCVECCDKGKTWCNECIGKENDCFNNGHNIILENHPFLFWAKGTPEEEKMRREYNESWKFKNLNHGEVFINTKEYEKALKFYKEALERNGGKEDQETAGIYDNIANIHYTQGAYDKAQKLYLQSFNIRKKIHKEPHVDLARSYHNLGIVSNILGHYKQAVEQLLKSLEIRKEVLGEQHLDVTYNNLGAAYKNLGQYEQAKEVYSQAIGIYKKIYGDQHPDTAGCYMNLGVVYQTLGDYKKAIELYLQSLYIDRAVFGEQHPQIADSYHNLGIAYRKIGKYNEAVNVYMKCLGVRKSILGENHPGIATLYDNLGTVHEGLDNNQKALELYSKSLDIRKRALKENHPDIAVSYNNLGWISRKMEKFEKARDFYSQSLAIMKECYGEEHQSTVTLYNNMGVLCDDMKDHKKAIELLSQALRIRKKVLGEQHPQVATTYNDIAIAYKNLGEYGTAIKMYSQALDIRKIAFNEPHPDIAASYYNLGNVYRIIKKNKEARDFYLQSLAMTIKLFGPSHARTRALLENLELVS